MGNVKEVLEKQLEREKESAMQKLTTDNLDAMFKITTTLCNMRKMECESIPSVMVDASETLIKKYSNGKYDKNIDALYDEYIAAKMHQYSSHIYRDWETDRKSTRLNSSHSAKSRMPSSA